MATYSPVVFTDQTASATGTALNAASLNALVASGSCLLSGTTPPGATGNSTLTYGTQYAVIQNNTAGADNGSGTQFVTLAGGTTTLGVASQDYYIDLNTNGTLTPSHVNNGSGAPAQGNNTLRLWKVVTDASDHITTVTLLAPTGVVVPGLTVNGVSTINGTVTAGGAINAAGTVTAGGLTVTDGSHPTNQITPTSGLLIQTGHVRTAGSAPSIAAQSPAGTGAAAVVSGSDCAGRITLSTGTGNTFGRQALVTFSQAFTAPKVVLTTANPNAGTGAALTGGAAFTVEDASPATAGFYVNAPVAPAASTIYYINYIVIDSA